MRGQPQSLVYPGDYHIAELAGQLKGMMAVLKEQTLVWEKLCQVQPNGKKPIGVCQGCKASAVQKDIAAKVAAVEVEVHAADEPDEDVENAMLNLPPDSDIKYCCVYNVLSKQQDFLEEKPLIQKYLESCSHKCTFLPKFHCELNPIEMYWGYGKQSKSLITSFSLIVLAKCFANRISCTIRQQIYHCPKTRFRMP
jgi:hypothetical protein